MIASERTAATAKTAVAEGWEPVLHDHVRVPDGREGRVIGFYHRETDTALVRFAAHDCTEYPISDIEPSWIGWDCDGQSPTKL